MNAVDTNVLIYAHDVRDSRKQEIAVRLIASLTDGVLLWQVACEYVAAARKLERLGFDLQQVWADLDALRRVWRAVTPTWQTMFRARVLLDRYSLSSWDALLVAACLDGGVTRLYSEDFDNSVRATGLEIVNPFAL